MKTFIRLFCLLLALSIVLAPLAAFADDPWDESYYRAIDLSDGLSDEERADLDLFCIEIMKAHEADVVLLTITQEELAGAELSYVAKEYYNGCNFGYGDDKTGFMFVYDRDGKTAEFICFGGADKLVESSFFDFEEEAAPGYEDEHGTYGVMYSAAKLLSPYLDEHAGDVILTNEPPQARADGKPVWFPEDPDSFEFFSDPFAPRVVDWADIFSESEEAAMEERLGEIRNEIGRDIVIYTDKTDYGFGHDVCAADFYDFNGYGVGPDREGVCLYVCMDPDNRGWWACCTGPETMGLYTEEYANQIDDALYEYMVGGFYGEGVMDWIGNIRTLYVKGMPFAPDWYPDSEKAASFERFHDADAPRIVDGSGILTADEIASLEQQARALSEKYGLDVVINTTNDKGSLSYSEYSDKFYYYNGYGYGDDYDGIMLTLFKKPWYTPSARITAEGKGLEKLSDVNRQRLIDKAIDAAEDDRFYDALSGWLDQTDHMLKTGRVPQTITHWIGSLLGGSFLGSIFAAVGLGRAKSKMKAPATKMTASDYLVPGGLSVEDAGTQFLNTTTSKTYSPVTKSSGGGGSSGGGRSSYSHSYSGHSSSSHSGSGRRF